MMPVFCFIDEAQNFPEIGLNLKILFDHRPDLKIMVTGSSWFDLASQIKGEIDGQDIHFYTLPDSGQRTEVCVVHISVEAKFA